MVDNWIDFTLSVIGGGMAFLFLFEGTRRLAAYGAHRRAALMMVLAAAVCALYGAFAYWKYLDDKMTLSVIQRKTVPSQQLPRDWGRTMTPEKRESASLARARNAFREAGEIGTYFDRMGEVRTFSPSLEDVQRRERVVSYYARAEYAARSSLSEALLWLILVPVAILLGLLLSLDKGPPGDLDADAGQPSP